MSLRPILCLLAAVFVPHMAGAQVVATPAEGAKVVVPRMFIEPSATHVSLGKASLTVSPLSYRAKTYVGDYKLTVVPYFFKSETGVLKFEAPDISMQKLSADCLPVNFIGHAVNGKDGKIKVIIGKAIPITASKGSVSVWIVTDNGMMIFNTSYHFAE